MSAHGPMPRSAWVFPVLAVLLFAVATGLGLGFTPPAFAGVIVALLILLPESVAGSALRAGMTCRKASISRSAPRSPPSG